VSTDPCGIPNPLERDGSGRSGRFLRALSPHYARVDERTLADFLRFAETYAKRLQYWDGANRRAGDWTDFFNGDVSSQLAAISRLETSQYRRWADELMEAAREAENAGRIRDQGLLQLMFRLIFAMAGEINEWARDMDPGSKLHESLGRIIASPLRGEMETVLDRFRCAGTHPWFAGFHEPAEQRADFWNRGGWALARKPGPAWFAGEEPSRLVFPSFAAWAAARPMPSACGFFAGLGVANERPWLLAMEQMRGSFDVFYNSLTRLTQEAETHLAETLTDWPSHQPHMALWIAFLKLRQYGQIHLNSITRRHLDFFYRRVLRVLPRPPVPDRVHVVFELAKGAQPQFLPKGALLKAGKDALGRNVSYRLNADTVISRAVILEPADLKSVFIDRADGGRVYAAALAASADGLGAPLTGPEPKWKPFGRTQKRENRAAGQTAYLAPSERSMAFAQVGFAFSSPVLDLREGGRTVHLLIRSVAGAADNLFDNKRLAPDQFRFRFSGAKGWYDAGPPSTFIPAGNTLSMSVTLPSSAPPVAPCAIATPGRGYDSRFPVLEILLRNDPEASAPPYGILKAVRLESIKVTVTVDQVRNLLLQNDLGPIKAGKPFQPFGPQPMVGSSLYVGSDEVFRKKLTALGIDCEWMGLPDDFAVRYKEYSADLQQSGSFRGTLYKLFEREWVPDKTGPEPAERELFPAKQEPFPAKGGAHRTGRVLEEKPIFPDAKAGSHQNLPWTSPANGAAILERAPDLEPIKALEPGTRQGFVRLELSSPSEGFGHLAYPRLLSQQTVSLAKYVAPAAPESSTPPELPLPPYTPLIKTISIQYSSEESLSFAAAPVSPWERFYHIHPFGTSEPGADGSQKPGLVPAFRYDPPDDDALDSPLDNEGELYIGLSHLETPCNLQLLFQVAEGTARPELPKQDVYWSYLRGDAWIPFQKRDVLSDTTQGLINSGILVLRFPGDADKAHTLLPAGRHWIRACVPGNSGAVCSLLEVAAQAAEASFADNGNDPAFLGRPLPAGTIVKLEEKRAEIKSVRQPYGSAAGRMAEASRDFDIRVSERLRHKGRALAMWDYEKSVLERFPFLYKVKCINHSTYDMTDPVTEKTLSGSEFAPGFVTLVVIPDQRNLLSVDPLQPRAGVGLLEKIRAFLAGRMPAFAARRLRVINPEYETIQAQFRVRFHGQDFSFTRDRLAADIRRFLSPWAYGDSGADLVFGGRIHRSTLLYFVEKLDYVDFVTEFKMNHGGNKNVEEALPSSSRTIFVSHAQHVIEEAK
jgi:hypothetical protein